MGKIPSCFPTAFSALANHPSSATPRGKGSSRPRACFVVAWPLELLFLFCNCLYQILRDGQVTCFVR